MVGRRIIVVMLVVVVGLRLCVWPLGGRWLMAGRARWESRLERRLWELLEDAPPRDGAPLARVLMDLKRGADPVVVKSKLDQLEAKRKARQAAG
jgi:hypothetical protein